jgi:hypothetical protein
MDVNGKLSDPGQSAESPQVAVDPNELRAVFVWERPDGTDCSGSPCTRIQTRVRAKSGSLSTIQSLSAGGAVAETPQVAVDPNGNAVYAWKRFDAEGVRRIQARVLSTAYVLSATQTLSDAGEHADAPQVGVDANGNAVFVWQRYDGTTDCSPSAFGCYRVQAITRSAADGTLSAVQTLSAAGQHGEQPEVAVAANGIAAADWRRFDGANYRIQGAGGP